MRYWVIGVLLAAIASFISNLGLNLQKLTHLRIKQKQLENQQHTDPDQQHNQHTQQAAVRVSIPSVKQHDSSLPEPARLDSNEYTRHGLWRAGLTLVILGSLVDFAALSFAAQSVVAPLGSLTLVSNSILAPLLLGETVEWRDILTTIGITVGTALSVIFADHRDLEYSVEGIFAFYSTLYFIIYASIVVVAIYSLRILIRRARHVKRSNTREYEAKWIKIHRFSYAASAGLIGAQSVLFAKCTGSMIVASFVHEHGKVLFLYWQSYFIIAGLAVTIFLQIKWLNQGLQRFEALYIVPVFQSFWILTSVIGGILFFQEYASVFNSVGNALGFPAGVILTVCGVYELSHRGSHTTDESIEKEKQQQKQGETGAEHAKEQQEENRDGGKKEEVAEMAVQRKRAENIEEGRFDSRGRLVTSPLLQGFPSQRGYSSVVSKDSIEPDHLEYSSDEDYTSMRRRPSTGQPIPWLPGYLTIVRSWDTDAMQPRSAGSNLPIHPQASITNRQHSSGRFSLSASLPNQQPHSSILHAPLQYGPVLGPPHSSK